MSSITWPLRADPSGFKSGLADASGAAKAFGSVLQGIGQGIGQKLFDGLIEGAKALPGALLSATKATVDLGSRLTELRDKTGVSIEGLQRLGYAAKLSGSDMESVAKGVNIFQKNLATGSSSAASALTALGLSAKELRTALPEDAFVQVAEAIKNVKNPTDQAALAMQLFGKAGTEMLPMIKAGLADAAAEAERLGLVMSSKTANAADALGDAVDALQMTFTALGRNVASVIVENESLHVAVKGLTNILSGLSKMVHDNREALSQWVTTGVAAAVRGMALLVEGAVAVRQAWNEMNRLVNAGLTRVLEADAQFAERGAFAGFAPGSQRAPDPAKAAEIRAQIKALQQQQVDSDRATQASTEFLSNFNAKLYELGNSVEAARGKTAGFTDDTKNLGGALLDLSTKADKAKKSLGPSTGAGAEFFLSDISLDGDVFSDNTARVVDTVTAATVGGTWTEAAAEISVIDATAQLTLGTMEDWAGATQAVAAAFQMLGISADSALGRTLGGISNTLTATGQLAASVASGNVAGMVQGGMQMAGSMYQSTQQAGAGNRFMGGLSTGMGIVPAGLSAIFGGGEAQNVEDMRNRMLEAQGGLEALGAKAAEVGMTLEAVFAAETVEEYTAALAELDAAMDPLAEAQAKLAEAVERYGFTVSELGPVMQEQALHEQFEQLFTDWQLLTASGIDHETVLTRMAPAMNEYVQSVMASGAAIPEAMRPALQSMVDMGLLTDDAGNAMQSLDGLTFAQSLSEDVRDVVEAVGRLVDAMNGIPNVERTLTVKKIVEGNGGEGPSIPEYASGGYIAEDQFAFLHAGETVVPNDMAQAWARAVSGGGGGGDIDGAIERLGDRLIDLLPMAFRNAQAGA